MKDNLRAAAQAAYRAMIAAELSDGSRKEWEAAVDGLKDALAKPVVKESLTTQPRLIERLRDHLACYWKEGDVAPQLTSIELMLIEEAANELAAAHAEIAELKEELNDKRRFCYAVELALDGLKGDYIEIIKELRKERGK